MFVALIWELLFSGVFVEPAKAVTLSGQAPAADVLPERIASIAAGSSL